MSNDQMVPAPAPTDLSTVTILVDGTAIPETFQLNSLAVTKGVNMIATARIIIYDGDAAEEDFPASASGDFVPGKEVEIQAGYHNEEDTIFKGIIVKHGIQVNAKGGTVLVLDCRDEAVKMTLGRKNTYFYEQKDSDIISEVCGNYSISTDVESTSATHKEMVQYNATDWDFVISRAEYNGLLAFNSDGELKIAKPDLGSSPIVSLRFGSTILRFSAEMDARMQYKAVTTVGWNQADQALVEIEGESPSLKEPGNLSGDDLSDVIALDSFRMHHTGPVTDQELQAWADATLMRSRLAKVQGNVTFQGVAAVIPGTVIEIGGVGDRFNGNVFVAGVLQEIVGGKWETTVEFGLNPKWFARKYADINELPAAGLIPGIHGLHIGKVVALEGDPDGEERIQVRMPTISTSEEGIWSRLASQDAGNNRGWVFRPEIDDEVVVGFMNGDPRYPVVMGQLHSSASPSHIPASDDNHEKGLLTRSELKLNFDDDKNVILIETPAGNKITLSEDDGGITIEDENSNTVVMSSDGIAMESPGEISIKATKDLTLEGMNVNVKASAQLKAEGSAGAEISSGATCVVKGSLVQIN